MAYNVVCQGFEGRSISLPVKVWGLLERVKVLLPNKPRISVKEMALVSGLTS
jgi:hypothetical protein